tara:strand:- start:1559 stop:1915 length:357 start_codon:yes stop_codon:yes gene_type:complete
MAYILTLPNQTNINISLQVGDLIYATTVSVNGGFGVSNTTQTQLLGPCSNIQGSTITVNPQEPGSSTPNPGSFIMFTKDNRANLSGLKGYFAELEFRNNSAEEAELFSVNMDVTESSK